MAASLLEEFEIHSLSQPLFNLGGYPITFTNSTLFMFLSIAGATALMVFAMRPQAIVPGRWQMLAELVYNTIAGMLEGTAGDKARPFFPLIFSIFIFILFCNLLGMFPGSLSVTSHIIVNLAIALMLFAVIIVTGFIKQGSHFLGIFVPPGVSGLMLVIMVPIEIISFLVRPFSLSVRLFANMLAGHILLGAFAGMTVTILAAGWAVKWLSILPMAINVGITGFEFFVAFLQAYVYAILSSVYLRDALESH